MFTPGQMEAFHDNGYIHGGRVLTDEQVEQLRGELDEVIRRHDQNHPHQVFIEGTAAFCQQRDCFLQVTNIRELSPMFAEVAASPPLVQAAAQLLGTPALRLFADNVLYKNARDRAVNDWHQDGPALDILQDPAQLVAAWIALDDVAAEDGCVCFARGSHRWRDAPRDARLRLNAAMAEESGESGAEPEEPVHLHRCLMRRGEVHFHHGLTWHCSLANTSGRPRRGFVVNYIPAQARYRAAGVHFLKPFVEVADGEVLSGRHFPEVRVGN